MELKSKFQITSDFFYKMLDLKNPSKNVAVFNS